MLAGVDRLDRDLTVGQMQGKFQMHVISNVGHAVHEDSPEDVAESISSFLVRHKLVEAKKYFQPVLPGCWVYTWNSITFFETPMAPTLQFRLLY